MRALVIVLCLFVIVSDGCFQRRERSKRRENFLDVIDDIVHPKKESRIHVLEKQINEKNIDISKLQDQLKKSESFNVVNEKSLGECRKKIGTIESSYNEEIAQKTHKISILKNRLKVKDDKLNECMTQKQNNKKDRSFHDKLNLKIKELTDKLQKQSNFYEAKLIEKEKTIEYLVDSLHELEEIQMENTELYNVIEEYKNEKRRDSWTISSLNAIIKIQRSTLRKAELPQPQSNASSNSSIVADQLEECKANLTSISEREQIKDLQIKELNDTLSHSQNTEEQLKNTLSQIEQRYQEKESGWVDDVKTLEKKLNIAENRLKEKEEKLKHVVSKLQKKFQVEINKLTLENADLQSKINELTTKDEPEKLTEEQNQNTKHQYKSYPNKRISHQSRISNGFLDEDECRSVCDDNTNCKAFNVDTITGICYITEEPIKESIVDSVRNKMTFNFLEQNVWIKLNSN
eukprot:NODE_2308_length_1619_cov_119.145053_g1980_i0.p1 GENE.NODE_2308_length_1619_cov_119.145053_g1980_i0~~NODE_2308_length_1619_cov_119.145053_g1980_i0.p1  ORF type:complete len:478 (-),score=76.33 NODE_2308_length_1619_cov_119.145053_g1980_i0:184-1566(-)